MDESKKYIKPGDLPDVAHGFNTFGKKADNRRLEFSKLLLTVYTPVSSGLVFLSTNLEFENNAQRVFFLILATSSVLIVLSALLERLGYFLISETQAKKFVSHVHKTGKALNKPVYGKKWHSKLVGAQIWILFSLLLVNVFSGLCAVYSFVLSK